MDALISGDGESHDRLVLEAVAGVQADTAVLFAQFSMERILSRECSGPQSAGYWTSQ